MSVNYCGFCGAAARIRASYCRVCGTSLVVASTEDCIAEPVTESTTRSPLRLVENTKTTHNGESRNDTDVSARKSAVVENITEKDDIIHKSNTSDSPRKDLPSGELPRVPSSVFAQASGLQSSSPLSARVTKSLIGFAVVLVFGASIGYYGQSLKSLGSRVTERNLVTPEQQSLRLIREGEVFQLEGKPEEAILSFRQALAMMPSHLPTYILLGQAFEQAGRSDEALKTYQQLLRKDPTNLDARFQVAEIQRERGNWREASDEYYRIISIDSHSLQAWAALATIESHVDPQNKSNGRKPFSRQLTMARVMAMLPSVQRSEPLLTTGSAPRITNNAQPPLYRDSLSLGRGDTMLVVEYHKQKGMDLLNAKAFEAAIRDLEIARNYNPKDKDLYYLLGSAYAGLGLSAQAADNYRRCNSGQYAAIASSGLKKEAKRLGMKKPPEMLEVTTESEIGLPNQPTINNSLK